VDEPVWMANASIAVIMSLVKVASFRPRWSKIAV